MPRVKWFVKRSPAVWNLINNILYVKSLICILIVTAYQDCLSLTAGETGLLLLALRTAKNEDRVTVWIEREARGEKGEICEGPEANDFVPDTCNKWQLNRNLNLGRRGFCWRTSLGPCCSGFRDANTVRYLIESRLGRHLSVLCLHSSDRTRPWNEPLALQYLPSYFS